MLYDCVTANWIEMQSAVNRSILSQSTLTNLRYSEGSDIVGNAAKALPVAVKVVVVRLQWLRKKKKKKPK